MAALHSRPLRGGSSNDGGGGRSTVANSTLLPRVLEDNVVAIDAEVKQSLMELLLGRHAVVREVWLARGSAWGCQGHAWQHGVTSCDIA